MGRNTLSTKNDCYRYITGKVYHQAYTGEQRLPVAVRFNGKTYNPNTRMSTLLDELEQLRQHPQLTKGKQR